MNEMSDDEFRALLRRLMPVEGQPRDEAAWAQFIKMFEPTIRFHSQITGRVPELQGIIGATDIVNSVWRRGLEHNWIQKFLDRNFNAKQVGGYFREAAANVWKEKRRGQQTQKRDASRNVPSGEGTEPAAPEQQQPDVLAVSNEFVQWRDNRLRAMVENEAVFTLMKQIIEVENTCAEAARELGMREHTFRRRFDDVCEQLEAQYDREFGKDGDDAPKS